MKGLLHHDDTHIEVEEKVLTYSKFHLLEGSTYKRDESEILMLRNQSTYFVLQNHYRTKFHCNQSHHLK